MPAASSTINYDVFISYARKDGKDHALRLQRELEAIGLRVWRDEREIDPAQDFSAEIEDAIESARYVVVCVTADVKRKDSFVRREIGYAGLEEVNKPILMARFEKVAVPILVANNTWLDFFKDWAGSFATLRRWLSGEAVATDRAEPSPVLPVDPYKRYLETLYTDLVESIRASVFSKEALTLRAVESVGDVPRQTRRLNPKFLASTLRDAPEPDPAPESFDSLQDAYAHARCDGRVLLLGEPGAGKTTTLLAFARDAAAARRDDPSEPLPVFARIAGWDSRSQTPLHDWLTAIYPELNALALQSEIEAGRALLLLDGLDELGSRRPNDPEHPEQGDYDPRERFLTALPAIGRVILSSRVEEYRQIGAQAALACAVRLEPLDDAQMQTYLADVPDLWQVIAADASLKEALRTPLLLALVRVGFEGAPEAVRALGNLNAGDLNDRIWDAFIDQRWEHEQARQRHIPLPYTAAELKQRLGMAVVRAMSDWRREDHTRILRYDVGEGDADSLIALAQRLALLHSQGDETVIFLKKAEPSFRFPHLRLRDALAFSTAMAALRHPDWDVR
ncbi:MAG: TIR domain-containing protein, partial [Anaerolineae bacterium]|nr:TIR domain-containing protein [Anaerolineae bacterium]